MCYLPGTNLPAPGDRRGVSEQPPRRLAASRRTPGAPVAPVSVCGTGRAGPAAALRLDEPRLAVGSAPPADAFAA